MASINSPTIGKENLYLGSFFCFCCLSLICTINSVGSDISSVSGCQYSSTIGAKCGQLYSHIDVFISFSSTGSRGSLIHWWSGRGTGLFHSSLCHLGIFIASSSSVTRSSTFTFDEVGSHSPVMSKPFDRFSLLSSCFRSRGTFQGSLFFAFLCLNCCFSSCHSFPFRK
jgi:hypothetical protein